MKVLLSWLHDFVEWTGTATDLAHVLTEVGLAVTRVRPLERGDAILEVDVTSNRGDCWSHLGIAREVAAALGQAYREAVLPEAPSAEDTVPATDLIAVEIEAPDLCPAYAARVVTRVAGTAPTPEWIARRLRRLGHRSPGAVVDATNFVMLERGQPLHAFDRARLRGARIVVRRSRSGEEITLLDGRTRRLPAGILVIADEDRPVAVAGVMGGAETEVTPSTTEVVIESARFDPAAIRASCLAVGLTTEASARFTRRIDPAECERASLRVAALLEESVGGVVARSAARAGSGWAPVPARRGRLRFARLHRVLGGAPVPPEEVVAVLRSLGFVEVRRDREAVEVEIPAHRGDVAIEEDLIEEVARIRGYGMIPVEVSLPVRPVAVSRADDVLNRARDVLAAAGFHEALTLPFVGEGLPDDASPWTAAPAVRVLNPVRAEEPLLRRSLLGPLLRSLERNRARGVSDARLFEAGVVFLPPGRPGDRPDEVRRLAAILDGEYEAVRGAADALLRVLRIEAAWDDGGGAAVPAPLAPGAAARATVGGRLLGWAGSVASEHLATLHVHRETFRVAAFEFDLDLLTERAVTEFVAATPSAHPETSRDLAVVVAESVPWAAIEGQVRAAAGSLLRHARPFDVFRGASIGEGAKSIAFRMTFGAADRTLTGSEVDAALAAVAARLEKVFGASIRDGR